MTSKQSRFDTLRHSLNQNHITSKNYMNDVSSLEIHPNDTSEFKVIKREKRFLKNLSSKK